MLNVGGFDHKTKNFKNESDVVLALREALADGILDLLKPMAERDPTKRVLAGDMLDVLFRGIGRTSPRHIVDKPPPLNKISSLRALLVQQPKRKASQIRNEARKLRKAVEQ